MPNIAHVYPLSPIQHGILFHSLYSPDSAVYTSLTSCIMQPAPNVHAFEQAWNEVMKRHVILRTAFEWEELDEAVQVVYDEVEIPLEKLDWRGLSKAEQQIRLQAYLSAERKRGFDFSVPPLTRLTLISLDDESAQFVWMIHHLLIDAWSEVVLFSEASAFYQAILKGQSLKLEPAPSYVDYVKWFEQQDMSEADAYWRRQLQGFSEVTPIGVKHIREKATAAVETHEAQEISLSAETTEALKAFARGQGVTLNTLTQGVWALLLSHYSGKTDIVFGITVSGRPISLPGAESIIGPFLNTLPVRVRLTTSDTVASWLKKLQAHTSELRQYEYSPLVRVLGLSDLQRDVPLFESNYVFQNAPVIRSTPVQERETRSEMRDTQSVHYSNYSLTFTVTPQKELELKLSYNTAVFSADVITRMLGHVTTLLTGLIDDPSRRIFDVPVLSPEERRRLVVEWNESTAEFPRDLCFHQMFEMHAAQTPNAVALELAAEQMSYGELNRRANQLARFLTSQGVGAEVKVALLLERSFEMVVALVGVVKAGGAYLPLDPQTPARRLEFILKDAGVSLVLTQQRLTHLLDTTADYRVWALDEAWESIDKDADGHENLPPRATPENLVYVIYTSGSTGTPKGVLIDHRGLVNYVNWVRTYCGIVPSGRSLISTPFSFDLTVTGLLTPLIAGATVELVGPEDELDALCNALTNHNRRYSFLKITPSHLEVLNSRFAGQREWAQVDVLMLGGEALPGGSLSLWQERQPHTRFINHYGPTETVVGCCIYEVPAETRLTGPVPIGRPLSNKQLYVLDWEMRVAPVGVTGEIYIGGEGMARGYLRRAALTAERFVPDPFSATPGSRLYRTGDVGRMRDDGQLEYLGRTDHQVKLRGFRIELGEIETVLRAHPLVKESAAVIQEVKGEKALVACLVLKDEEEVSLAQVRDHVSERLPDYMVPTVFLVLPELPLTSNGKVDRTYLQTLKGNRLTTEKEFTPPKTPVEEVVAGIWAEVFGFDSIGAYDNYFQLGGHSLLGMRIIAKVREVFRTDLPMRTLFNNPVLSEFAREVEGALNHDKGISLPPLQPASKQGDIPLSFAQLRLWIVQQLDPESTAYNISQAVRLKGNLNVSVLEATLSEIVRRHETLRTVFAVKDGQPIQVVTEPRCEKLAPEDLSALEPSEREAQAIQIATEEAEISFDLEKGPLFRVRLLRLSDDEHVLIISRHHIIFDPWSREVLSKELVTLYEAFARNRPSPLPELGIQYADFAVWQRQWLESDNLKTLLDYWKKQLAGAPVALNLPADRPATDLSSYQCKWQWFTLDGDSFRAIRELSQSERVTVYMTLVAAFKTFLYRYTGQTDFLIGSPVTSRERVELEPLIGCFMNMLVLRTDLSGNPSFRQLLGRVRDTVLDAHAHQEMPFEKLVEELKLTRNQINTPLVQTVFSHVRMAHVAPKPGGLEVTPLNVEVDETAKFDWLMLMVERNEEILASLQYRTDMFDDETIHRAMSHFENVFHSVLKNPDARLDEIEMLSPEERLLLQTEIDLSSVSRSFSF